MPCLKSRLAPTKRETFLIVLGLCPHSITSLLLESTREVARLRTRAPFSQSSWPFSSSCEASKLPSAPGIRIERQAYADVQDWEGAADAQVGISAYHIAASAQLFRFVSDISMFGRRRYEDKNRVHGSFSVGDATDPRALSAG